MALGLLSLACLFQKEEFMKERHLFGGSLLLVPLLALAIPQFSLAAPFSCDPTSSNQPTALGTCSGSLTFTPLSATSASLTVELTNLTLLNGSPSGFITAFAFNNPHNLISTVILASSTLSLSTPTFDFDTLLSGATDVTTRPFGQFDFVLTAGTSFRGGTSPTEGIPAGATGTFVFNLTGTSLNTLSPAAFESELSVPAGEQCCEFFAVRFRGIDGQGDKQGVTPLLLSASPEIGPGAVVPEPASVLLLASGLAGLAGYRSRRGWRPFL
jgi:PEP-CTERM motif-containing protein